MRMRDYALRRLLLVVVVLLGVSIITFVLMYAVPINPARMLAGEKASEETVRYYEEYYGLNLPVHQQYFRYMIRLLHGDMGESVRTTTSVSADLLRRLPATLELGLCAMMFAIVVGIFIGIYSATHRNKVSDHVSRIFALTGISVPVFWLGLMLILIFYSRFGWFPAPVGRLDIGLTPPGSITRLYVLDSILTGNLKTLGNSIYHLILPAFCLGWLQTALIMRMMRSSMLEVIRAEYIKTARAKGLSERVVIYKHALKNAMIPTTTVIGLSVGYMFAGAIMTEAVFNWNGMGTYLINGINHMDYPAIMGFVLLTAFIYALTNLIVDLLYGVLDPRIRYG